MAIEFNHFFTPKEFHQFNIVAACLPKQTSRYLSANESISRGVMPPLSLHESNVLIYPSAQWVSVNEERKTDSSSPHGLPHKVYHGRMGPGCQQIKWESRVAVVWCSEWESVYCRFSHLKSLCGVLLVAGAPRKECCKLRALIKIPLQRQRDSLFLKHSWDDDTI